MTSRWAEPEHARWYLDLADRFPHRAEGEAVLLEQLPGTINRVLDLGTGDGRLMAMVLAEHPEVRQAIGVDLSPPMLERARSRFAADPRVAIVDHDLSATLPDLGRFDVVVSSLAIHHLIHPRKRELCAEIFDLLEPGGLFCNLEHVSSPTPSLHLKYRRAMGIDHEPEDPSNLTLDFQTQLDWLREIGFADVDVYWKWMETALLSGVKPWATN